MARARLHLTGPKLIELLHEVFELRGEDLVRRRTGWVVKPGPSRSKVVSVTNRLTLQYHRIKFALANGWLPDEVDHRDRDRDNTLLSNLRAATHSQNMMNRETHRALPRGVYLAGSRFRAMVQLGGKLKHLGCFVTPAEASQVVEARLKIEHGEFYHAPVQR